MNTKLFRRSSIERVNSPEQLNEYIRVAEPGVWVILAAIVALLVGVLIWGIFGNIETTVDTGIVVHDGVAVCYLSAEDAERIEAGMSVTIDGAELVIKSIADIPVMVDDDFEPYLLYLNGFEQGTFCYEAMIEAADVPDGVYPAVITVESIHPIAFVIH